MQYQPPTHAGDTPHGTPTLLSSLALVALPLVVALLALGVLSGDWVEPAVGVAVIAGVVRTAVRLRPVSVASRSPTRPDNDPVDCRRRGVSRNVTGRS